MSSLNPEDLHVISFETTVPGEDFGTVGVQMAPVLSAVGNCYNSNTQCDTC